MIIKKKIYLPTKLIYKVKSIKIISTNEKPITLNYMKVNIVFYFYSLILLSVRIKYCKFKIKKK